MAGDDAAPAVSVIMPTYNALEFLRDALEPLRAQTLGTDRFEVIIVDDGSSDGTLAYLEQERASWPGLQVIPQPHTGRPGEARNVGIERATGRYVFFHDADDWLGDEALERWVTAADRYDSDVVVGRIQKVTPDGRRAGKLTGAVDADLIGDGVWRSLGPQKLFRRALLERHGLRFPDDMVQGEDQVFVATALFAASRVTTLDDYDYYFRRQRADGGNLSRRSQPLRNKLLTVTRMSRLIVRHVDPAVRSPYLDRILLRTLAAGLGGPYLGAEAAERAEAIATLKAEVLPLLDDRHLAEATDVARLRLWTALRGTADDLVDLNRWLPGRTTKVAEGVLVYALPARLEELLPEAVRRAREPLRSSYRLVDVQSEPDGIRLGIDLELPLHAAAPDQTCVEFVRRGKPLTVRVDGAPGDRPGRYQVHLRPHRLAAMVRGRAVWDVNCVALQGGALIATARVDWDDRLAPADEAGEPDPSATTAVFGRTRSGYLRLTTTSPPRPAPGPARRAIRRLRRLLPVPRRR
ncbi:glycosyltransferase [Microlunatus sp. GCM10028923]|uniref:glycosyltransferase n=1 Tax=Microlunatus sp. GCM10028923 TaxID=3273400 RepID=UPI0036171DD7